MENNKKEGTSKKRLLRIIIPFLILVVVWGIWFAKNADKSTAQTNESPIATNNDKSGTATTSVTDDANAAADADADATDFALHVTEKLDLDKLKSYGIPIVIDFGADSCIPCKKMAPVLKELNAELQGKAIVKFVDVWKYQDFSEGYPISLIPTQIFIDAKGKPYTPKDPDTLQLKQYTLKDTGEHVFTTHEGGLTKDQLLSALKEMGLK